MSTFSNGEVCYIIWNIMMEYYAVTKNNASSKMSWGCNAQNGDYN